MLRSHCQRGCWRPLSRLHKDSSYTNFGFCNRTKADANYFALRGTDADFFTLYSISIHRSTYILFSLTDLCIAIRYHTVVKTNSWSEKEVSKKCANACSNVPSVKGHSSE